MLRDQLYYQPWLNNEQEAEAFYRNDKIGLVSALKIRTAGCPAGPNVNSDSHSGCGLNRSINGYGTKWKKPHIVWEASTRSEYDMLSWNICVKCDKYLSRQEDCSILFLASIRSYHLHSLEGRIETLP